MRKMIINRPIPLIKLSSKFKKSAFNLFISLLLVNLVVGSHHNQYDVLPNPVALKRPATSTKTTSAQLQQNSTDWAQFKLNEILVSGSFSNNCEQAARNLDKCSAALIGIGRASDLSLPDTMAELNSQYCPKVRETVSCIKNSTSCYKPFERQIINWVLTSTRKMNYKRCKNEGEKERFLRLTKSCLGQMGEPMNECMSTYIASLEAIADLDDFVERLSEDDIQIQLSCCANRRFKSCVTNDAKRRCRPLESLKKLKRTNSISSSRSAHKHIQRAIMDTMEDLKSTLDGMALTGPEFICSSVDENFCRSKFDGRFRGRNPRHMSILPAMIKIYANRP